MRWAKSKLRNYEGHRVVRMPIWALWQSVEDVKESRPKFYTGVYDSIKKDGLENPIIVVKTDREGLEGRKQKHKNSMKELPDAPPHGFEEYYVIWGGSNRVAILKELRYTHVDCIILNSFDVAYRIQAKQRNSYKGPQ